MMVRDLSDAGRAARTALLRGAGLTLLVIGLAACSGDQGGEAASTAGGMVAAERVANCAGFTAETAAKFLGVPAADVKDQSADVYAKLRSCDFVSSDDSKRISFSLRRDDSVEEAADEMATFRGHLGVGTEALDRATGTASDAAPYEEVPDLGEEAVWARVNGTLNVREGNVSIQVLLPQDRAEQQRLAALVVAGLR
jgi:hypothetical protein